MKPPKGRLFLCPLSAGLNAGSRAFRPDVNFQIILPMQLFPLGWSAFFAEAFQPYQIQGLFPARVAIEHRREYAVLSESGTMPARCSGRLVHQALSRRHYPAVGDWVAAEPRGGETATIHAVLPRRSILSRAAAGGGADEQVMAANVETLFIVTGLDQNHNLRRIERYLVLGRESGAEVVVLLNKTDLCDDAAERRRAVEGIAGGAAVISLSALTGDGLAAIEPFLCEGRTVALLGSSGVGKSTLVNRRCGGGQATGSVREDDSKGRHTTTARHLIPLPGGGLLLDTPGMRELGLWDGAEGLDATFGDVTGLIARCRFRDCGHETEPGCAIRAALESGELEPDRFASWRKLQREQAFADRRHNPAVRRQQKAKRKRTSIQHRRSARFPEDSPDAG